MKKSRIHKADFYIKEKYIVERKKNEKQKNIYNQQRNNIQALINIKYFDKKKEF